MAVRAVFDEREVDAGVAGVCGAYCGACPVYRGWVEQDAPRLEALARSFGVPVSRIVCTGCRSPTTFCFGGDCEIKSCARKRGVVFCPECVAYPCSKIERFEAGAPYRTSICEDASRITDVGWYAWLREEDAKWRCEGCHAKVAADASECPACGRALVDL